MLITEKQHLIGIISSMSKDRRTHSRATMSARVRVSHPMLGNLVLDTRNISDGGVFIEIEDETLFPPIGDHVHVQVQDLPVEAPVRKMKVVRHTREGIGLCFVGEND